MSIPNVSTLYYRIKKGSEGGHEFARILNQLLIADSKEKDYTYIATSDASGDYKGVDGIMILKDEKIGFQFKFYPNPMTNSQKYSVLKSFSNAIKKFPDMTKWIIVTPEDFDFRMMEWFDSKFKDEAISCHYWGHTYILDLMIKHPHIADFYYSELRNFKHPTEPSNEDIETFFIQFTKSREKTIRLLLNAQPSFSDCKLVFSSEFAGPISDIYHIMYQSFVDSNEAYETLKKNRVKIDSATIAEIQNLDDQLPGGMRQIFAQNALNAGIKFYNVHYLKDNDEWGIGQSVWCYIEGRWVFFPKPWKAIKGIQNVKNSKDIQRFIRVLKLFGFKKYIEEKSKVDLGIMFNYIADEMRNS